MLPGLFRTLIGLVVAWFVFRFLDRMFGGSTSRKARSPERGPSDPARKDGPRAKDDHLGEYVDFEELDGDEEDGAQAF